MCSNTIPTMTLEGAQTASEQSSCNFVKPSLTSNNKLLRISLVTISLPEYKEEHIVNTGSLTWTVLKKGKVMVEKAKKFCHPFRKMKRGRTIAQAITSSTMPKMTLQIRSTGTWKVGVMVLTLP